MAGRNKRNSRKQRKARAKSYPPNVVVRANHVRRLQMLANDEDPCDAIQGEVRLDPALHRSQGWFATGQYFAAVIAFVSGAVLTVSELFKR